MSPWSTVNLDGAGHATYTISTLPEGPDTVSVYYLGDANNAPSIGSMTENITSADLQLPVVITVTSSINPALYGNPVTFHVSNFYSLSGNIVLDSSGNATWTTSSLPPGADNIQFSFFTSNKDYLDQSVSFTENITPLGTATTPVISPASGVVYSSSQTVTVTDSAPGQIIFYEILPEGSTVTAFSGNPYMLGYSGYTGPITINQSQTVAAAAYETGYNWSPTVSANCILAPNGQLPAPTFSPSAGAYASTQNVSINDSVASASVFYTTDGSQPTQSSTRYGGPIQVSSSETMQAIATAAGYSPSNVASAAYVINLPAPDFSVSLNPAAMNISPGRTGTSTLTISPLNGFNQNVAFTCSGLPTGVSCSFSPSTVNPSGNSDSATMTVTASSNASIRRAVPFPFVPVSALSLAVCWAGFKKRKLGHFTLWILLAGVSMLASGGCGSGGSGGQASQTSPITTTVTVTAASGSLSHSATLTLTVE